MSAKVVVSKVTKYCNSITEIIKRKNISVEQCITNLIRAYSNLNTNN